MAEEKKEKGLKKIKALVDMMIENDLLEVEIIEGDNKIHLKRPGSAPMQAIAPIPVAPGNAPVIATTQTAAAGAEQIQQNEDEDLVDIISPMIGTFYSAPSPDSDPFVSVGDSVTTDTVVCVVEAMKVMNEIKAEATGTIEKVLIANGQAVEFGQVLFRVRPV